MDGFIAALDAIDTAKQMAAPKSGISEINPGGKFTGIRMSLDTREAGEHIAKLMTGSMEESLETERLFWEIVIDGKIIARHRVGGKPEITSEGNLLFGPSFRCTEQINAAVQVDEVLTPQQLELTDEQILCLIDALHNGDTPCTLESGGSGGHLHVVIDDFNTEDQYIEQCIRNADTDGCRTCGNLGRILLTIPAEHPKKLVIPEWMRPIGEQGK